MHVTTGLKPIRTDQGNVKQFQHMCMTIFSLCECILIQAKYNTIDVLTSIAKAINISNIRNA